MFYERKSTSFHFNIPFYVLYIIIINNFVNVFIIYKTSERERIYLADKSDNKYILPSKLRHHFLNHLAVFKSPACKRVLS